MERHPTRAAHFALPVGLALLAAACGGRRPRAARAPTAAGAAFDRGVRVLRFATGTVLRHPAETIAPPPPDALGRDYALCAETLRALGLDLAAENAPALATARAAAAARRA